MNMFKYLHRKISDFRASLGGLSDRLTRLISPYISYIYLTAALLIIFLIASRMNDYVWQTKLEKSENERISLLIRMSEASDFNGGLKYMVKLQNEKIKEQYELLLKAEEIIKDMNNSLNKLIEYLKSIDDWPPKFPEIDKNKAV